MKKEENSAVVWLSKKPCHLDFLQLIIAPITLSKVNYEIFLQKEMSVCRDFFFSARQG